MGKHIRFGLHDAYYDPKTGFGGLQGFRNASRDEGYSLDATKDFLRHQEARQLNLQTKNTYFPIWGLRDGTFQADLMFFPAHHSYNALLTIINVNTRVAYAYPLKGKTAENVLAGFEQWFQDLGDLPCTHIQTDNGTEFKNKSVKKLWDEHGLEYDFCDPADHTAQGKIERFNETFRGLMTQYLDAYRTRDWVGVVKDLIYNYNHRFHRSIGCAPSEATELSGIHRDYLHYQEASQQFDTFHIGDKVRILEDRNIFDKGRKHWSPEVSVVDNIMGHLIHVNGNWYKHYELQRVIGDVQTKDIVPVERQPLEKVVKPNRKLNKEGVKNYLAEGEKDIIESEKRRSKKTEVFEAKPSNLKDLKALREIKEVKNPRKKFTAGDVRFIEFKESKNSPWIVGENLGLQKNGKYLIHYLNKDELMGGDEVLYRRQVNGSSLKGKITDR